jgi:hypothetical protein
VTCLLICKQGRGIYNMSHGIGKKEWSSVGLLVTPVRGMEAIPSKLWRLLCLQIIIVKERGSISSSLLLVFVDIRCQQIDATLAMMML